MVYKSCQYIEGGLTFQSHGVTVCCAVRNAPNWHIMSPHVDSDGDLIPYGIILDERSKIIQAIIGKNEKAYAYEAILLNVWCDTQPVWDDFTLIEGVYSLSDDINAPRQLLCLTGADNWAKISLHGKKKDVFYYLQAICSKYSGILRVDFLGKTRESFTAKNRKEGL